MIIDTINLVLFYFFWIYILIFLVGKQCYDRHKRKRIMKAKLKIQQMFQNRNELEIMRLQQYGMIDILFIEILNAYQKSKDIAFRKDMIKVLEYRIVHNKKLSKTAKLLNLKAIVECNLVSTEINDFINRCHYDNDLDHYWLSKASEMVVE